MSSFDEETLPGDDVTRPSAFSVALSAPGGLDRGDTLGRYIIVERIGSGGMGVVYAAYDPELNRKIAVKLLRPSEGAGAGTDGSQGHQRLLREAQAMARLSHPNVVTVYDVGLHEGAVFVAMEFVEGLTLDAWIARARPSLERILDVFARAGAGLVAAHAVGLVHRDFKPENVMVGDDGRVLVMDFGLARSAGDHEDIEDAEQVLETAKLVESASGGNAFSNRLTHAGAVLGTPKYMAPEQHMGTSTDARTDQFSFCVTLYEAVYGDRPFKADSLVALAYAVTDGKVRDPPAGSSVPAWLRRALLRGLAADPDARWPSMQALLAALTPPRTRHRLWMGALVVGVVGIGVGALATRGHEVDACASVGAELDEVWGDATRSQVEAAFSATGLPFAERAFARVSEQLDAFAADWKHARIDACREREMQSADLADRRLLCLADRERELRALVDVLGEADGSVVGNAVGAAHGLPSVDQCSDVEWLLATVKPPDDPIVAAQVEQVRERLAGIKAQETKGDYEAARSAAQALLTEAEALDYAPVEAEVVRELGSVANRIGDNEVAEQLLQRAYYLAAGAGHDELAAAAASDLIWVCGLDLQKPADGHVWARHARMEVQRFSGPPKFEEVILSNLGSVLWAEGKYAEASEHYRRSLAIAEERGADADVMAQRLQNIGLVEHEMGNEDEAIAHLEKALASMQGYLGEDHPQVHAILSNLGNALDGKGLHEEAVERQRQSLRVARAVWGEKHENTARGLENIGIALAQGGHPEEAIDYFRQSHEIRAELFEPGNPKLANSHLNYGTALRLVGKREEALAHIETALAAFEGSIGPEHPTTGNAHHELGIALRELDRLDESLEHARRATAVFEPALGKDHPHLALTLGSEAETLRRLGKTSLAREQFDRALAIVGERDVPAEDAAAIRFGMAQVLPKSASARAVELAAEARAVYADGPGREDELAEVDAWLAEHGAG